MTAAADHDDEIKTAVAIAVLQQNYQHLDEKVDAVIAGQEKINTSIQDLVVKMSEEKSRRSMMSRALGLASHAVTGGLTLVAAKILHVPLNLG